ncbi:MAG: Hpt domain-containing protein [Hahellaceae bacterium]|jgi:chemotaxis protein histidine kinase CheA|nr:Hpt domain-containing protein [Hahellaceae bacterium]
MAPEIQMEALLKQLARQFVDELPERLHAIEEGIRTLFEQPQDEEVFLELYRRVHSLKGAGGTYDAMILTHIRFYLHQYLDWMH